MSKIEDIADTEFDALLEQVDLGELSVVESHIDEWQVLLEELLGVVSAPVVNMHPTTLFRDGLLPGALSSFPLMGMVIALIDHARQLFA